jgi:hypothetical protein
MCGACIERKNNRDLNNEKEAAWFVLVIIIILQLAGCVELKV